jgi:hypothetical protein
VLTCVKPEILKIALQTVGGDKLYEDFTSLKKKEVCVKTFG